MPRPVRLEVLAPPRPAAGAAETLVLTAEALEETRLEAFERGYRAGWDDAVAAQQDEARQLRAEVGRNLQALAFTYHEARAHLLGGIAPLLEAMLARVLPATAGAALGAIVRETLEPLAAEALDRPVTLALHPAARAAVEAALDGLVAPPVALREEPALAPGEVRIVWSGGERRIDLDAAVAAIAAAVRAFLAEAAAAPGAPPAADPVPPPEEMRRHG